MTGVATNSSGVTIQSNCTRGAMIESTFTDRMTVVHTAAAERNLGGPLAKTHTYHRADILMTDKMPRSLFSPVGVRVREMAEVAPINQASCDDDHGGSTRSPSTTNEAYT